MKVITLCKLQDKLPTAPELCTKNFIESIYKSDLDFLHIEYFSNGKIHSIWNKLFGRKQNNNFEQLGIISLFFRLISIKPNIIHILNFERVWIVAIIYKLFFNCKIVFTVHGCVLHEHLNYKTGVPYFLFLKDRICEFLYFKFSDKTVFVSDNIKRTALSYYNIKSNKIEIIPNGYKNINRTINANLKRNGIVFVGSRRRVEKGLNFLLSALEIIKCQVNVFIVGEKNNNIFIKNKNVVIETIPIMERNDFLNFLNTIKIFVSPSIADSFGLIIQEALNLNLQVIATTSCGITEFYKHNNLHLIEFGDVQNFAKLIDNLINIEVDTEPDNLFLNWDYVANKYFEIYKNLK